MGMHSRVWDPHVSENRTQLCVFLTSMHALKIPPPLKNSLRGTLRKVSRKGSKIATLTSCSGRAFSIHMSIFGAIKDRWRNTRAQGSVLKTPSNSPSCKPKRWIFPLADPPRSAHRVNFVPNRLRNSPWKFQRISSSRLGPALNTISKHGTFPENGYPHSKWALHDIVTKKFRLGKNLTSGHWITIGGHVTPPSPGRPK